MKILGFILIFIFSHSAMAESLCFSPVKEKEGDKSTERSWRQGFNYKVQVDDGPVITPSAESSTSYEYVSKSPMVKIWLGSEIVQSFRVSEEVIKGGRNCIWFYNMYETWNVVEKWQADKLCSCL